MEILSSIGFFLNVLFAHQEGRRLVLLGLLLQAELLSWVVGSVLSVGRPSMVQA